MKGSAITGPVAKEAAELWPVSFNPLILTAVTVRWVLIMISPAAYCVQLRCCDVKGLCFRKTSR